MVLEKETNLYLDNAIKNKFEQQETALSIFINEQFVPEMTNIQSQVDSKIETWYQPTDPSLSWSTDDDKALHVGDLWYNTDGNQNTTSRWDGTAWVSQNVPTSVFDAIDSKAQVFVSKPIPPYNIGDLWVQGYTGNILKCKTSRSSGVYVDSDWELASKYTDDSVFTNWLSSTFAPTLQDLTNQVDQKAETWYQSDDPALDWTTAELQAEHIGDLWYRTTDNVTLRYSDTGWVEQAAPKAVFDAIDGKAQIFINQPTVPYNVGDLWFDSSTGDILTCINKRAKGNFTSTDWAKRNKYTDDSALTAFITNVFDNTINTIQEQIDGKIQTWYQSIDPSLKWTTTAEQLEHGGDLWYNSTLERYYRWKIEPSKYLISRKNNRYTTRSGKYLMTPELSGRWEELTANPPTEVFDTIDSKAQIFVSEPVPPYEVGDLWVQGVTGDILKCKTAKASGVFDNADWELASKYTDDSALTNWLQTEYPNTISQLELQIDQKAETWYQSTDPSTVWTTDDLKRLHIGDIWFDSSVGKQATSQKSWRWTGAEWEELKTMPPAELIDTIDGKAQVFVNEPYVPYNVGDIWFNENTKEILTCTKSREEGSFLATDWAKLNHYTDDSALNTFLNGDYKSTINNINNQIDQKAETWYQANDPSTSWTTAELQTQHIGDLWFDTTDNTTQRWNGTKWVEQSAPKAVFDAIDGKAQIFTSQPKPPYNVGDLWFNSTSSDILVCIKTNTTSTYKASDWAKRDKYTDDSALNTFLQGTYADTINDLRVQADQKAETWYQSTDPSSSWEAEELDQHIGDIWYNTDDTSNKYYMWSGTGWNIMKVDPPDSVMNTLNGKAQIFISQPTPPYNIGDLWFNSDTSDILTCIKSRSSGSYTASEWAKRNKYTDNTVADDAIAKLSARYGTSDTAANKTVKIVTLPNFNLFTGAQITVRFEHKNTAVNPRMNVNGKGAKLIHAYGLPISADSVYNWGDGAVVDFVYDGTVWVMVDNGSLAKVNDLNTSLNQEAILKRLTNNYQAEGIYLENGQLYIKFTYARGGTLKLGGANNGNGTLSIIDASGAVVGTIDNNGLMLNKGSISLNNGRFSVTNNGDVTAMSLTAYGSLICYETYTFS